ncbi:myo-inositol-1(or 4)-monophosphatase [Vreelandella songnenensis]|uniref:Inositol-1-monophosphatase n=1 Tax=Vreelandella songnenensis TaxID=1176243 RepID=A0A2T0V678_9GAMM|nr:inositol monophosphatase family protein [Halomonas songnenensis]PRY65680.1 myo-inositol-1(or 4)-monophosphatase [Halomonas songnenensis]
MPTLQERLTLAISIAEEAGELIREARANQSFSKRLKADEELVTDVDVAVDKLIKARLNKHFPGEALLSEELSPDRALNTETTALWVVDPIDGTVNFAQGLRHVAVSIGWMENGVTKVGVVHAPFLQETFSAAEGSGAFCNQQRITSSNVSTLAETLVGTGFPYQKEARQALMPRLFAVLAHCRDVRRNGAAALDLCDVACGRLDAYYETVSPWDFVAGWLIAREAGARVGHLGEIPAGVPADLYPNELLVAASGIYDAMKQLLLDAK